MTISSLRDVGQKCPLCRKRSTLADGAAERDPSERVKIGKPESAVWSHREALRHMIAGGGKRELAQAPTGGDAPDRANRVLPIGRGDCFRKPEVAIGSRDDLIQMAQGPGKRKFTRDSSGRDAPDQGDFIAEFSALGKPEVAIRPHRDPARLTVGGRQGELLHVSAGRDAPDFGNRMLNIRSTFGKPEIAVGSRYNPSHIALPLGQGELVDLPGGGQATDPAIAHIPQVAIGTVSERVQIRQGKGDNELLEARRGQASQKAILGSGLRGRRGGFNDPQLAIRSRGDLRWNERGGRQGKFPHAGAAWLNHSRRSHRWGRGRFCRGGTSSSDATGKDQEREQEE